MPITVNQSQVHGEVDLRDADVTTSTGQSVLVSNMVIAGAIAGADAVTVTYETFEDTHVLEILRALGGDVDVNDGESEVVVRNTRLTGTEIDVGEVPELFPGVAVLTTVADGSSRIENCRDLRARNPDWVATMATALDRLGSNVEEETNSLTIHGGGESILKGTTVTSNGEPHIAMALTLAGMIAFDTTEIDGADAATEMFPKYFEYLSMIGADITVGP